MDNSGAVDIANSWILGDRTCYLDECHYFLQELIDLDMLIIYSPNNTFEQIIEAQGPADIKGTEIRVCRPEWMSRSALKNLLMMLASSLRD